MVEGWVSRIEMYTNGLSIPNFPVQTDQVDGRLWIRPGNTADILTPVRIVDSPMGSRYAYGGITWQWPLVNLSPRMTAYIQETFFQPNGPPADFFFREYSSKLTVQTFNRGSGEWETYHTWARFADFKNEASPSSGGYTDLLLTFTAFAVAPKGPDLSASIAFDSAPPHYEGLDASVVFNIQNVGDGSSLSNSQWEIAIPANTELVSYSQLYPTTLEYSTDNGSSYSTLPPSPISQTTNLRGTLTDELPAGDVTGDYTIALKLNVAGDVDVFVTVATDADQNAGNDTASDTITVLPFSPIALLPLVWLDGNEDVATDALGNTGALDNDPVQVWGNQADAGGDYDMSQSTTGQRPAYAVNELNGQNGLNFDGTDDELIFTSPTTEIEGDMTWFVVLTPQPVVPGGETLISFGWRLDWKVPVGTLEFNGVDGGTSDVEITTAVSGDQILTYSIDLGVASETRLYRNGAFVGSANSGVFSAFGSSLRIATDGTSTHHFGGIIYEIIGYNETLTGDQRNLVIDYLKAKYGIA